MLVCLVVSDQEGSDCPHRLPFWIGWIANRHVLMTIEWSCRAIPASRSTVLRWPKLALIVPVQLALRRSFRSLSLRNSHNPTSLPASDEYPMKFANGWDDGRRKLELGLIWEIHNRVLAATICAMCANVFCIDRSP